MDSNALRGAASLLRAGMLATQAVDALRANGALPAPEAEAIRGALGRGEPFARALAPFLRPAQAAILEAGEASGRLVESLDRLALLGERERSERRVLLSRLWYPILLFAFAVLILPVAPAFATDRRLFGPSWWRSVLPVAIVSAALLLAARTAPARALLARVAARMPGFAQARRHARQAEFAAVLAAALDAGMLPGRALPLAASAAGSDGTAAGRSAESGGSFAASAALAGLLDAENVAILRTAELAGESSAALVRIAAEEEERARHIRERALETVGKLVYFVVAIWIGLTLIGRIAGIYGAALR